jgi:hypothetical protein
VAARLGIDEVRAEVLSEDKARLVRELQAAGARVAVAGDGVNDAPALAQADVGIAMRTGADVAIERAGITLVKGDLLGIVWARRLALATMRNIRQNLVLRAGLQRRWRAGRGRAALSGSGGAAVTDARGGRDELLLGVGDRQRPAAPGAADRRLGQRKAADRVRRDLGHGNRTLAAQPPALGAVGLLAGSFHDPGLYSQ